MQECLPSTHIYSFKRLWFRDKEISDLSVSKGLISKHKDPESPHQKLGMEVYAGNLSLTEELKQIDS